MSYLPTAWVDKETPVDAMRLNKLETAVADAHSLAENSLGMDDLDAVIETALTSAKKSGDFRGEPGVSGVYVGSGQMPEGYNIQIDPNGQADVPATQAYVDARIQTAIDATWEAQY